MITYKQISPKEKKELLQTLKKQFGIKEIPGELFRRGTEKVFLYNGNFNKKEIERLQKIAPVERVGVYFLKKEPFGVRLSIEGSQILANQITKNIFKLNDEQFEQWMTGQEILVETRLSGPIAIKHKNNFVGCGKASESKITNFVPKNRRLKMRD